MLDRNLCEWQNKGKKESQTSYCMYNQNILTKML